MEYVKNNPKLTSLFTSDGLVILFLLAGGILANFGEILPAGIVSILGTITKIYNILVTSGLLNTREEIIYEETGQTVNEILYEEESNEDTESEPFGAA